MVSADVMDYRDSLGRAYAEAARHRYKDAYNLLGQAPWRGAREDQEVRRRRGMYAYMVARERLDGFRDAASPRLTLIKAGCWLARSEAYLASAAEGVEDGPRREAELFLDRTKAEQRRFRDLCGEFGEDLFVRQGERLDPEGDQAE